VATSVQLVGGHSKGRWSLSGSRNGPRRSWYRTAPPSAPASRRSRLQEGRWTQTSQSPSRAQHRRHRVRKLRLRVKSRLHPLTMINRRRRHGPRRGPPAVGSWCRPGSRNRRSRNRIGSRFVGHAHDHLDRNRIGNHHLDPVSTNSDNFKSPPQPFQGTIEGESARESCRPESL
jgi:hypothetical protein